MNVLSHRLWLTAALAVGFASLAAAQTKPKPTLEYVPGQVIVKFRPGFAGVARTTHSMIGARVKREITAIGTQTIQLRAGMSVEQAVKYYRGLVGVQAVTPNYKRKLFFAPNDPRYGEQYWLPRINAPAAWDFTLGAPTTKVAVVDSGVDYNHEDLKGKVILGKDTIDNDNDPIDEDDHGTHVAGIVAANTNNGVGVAGIGFNCQIIAIRSLGRSEGDSDSIAAGIVNAVDMGAQVINLSLGGYGFTQSEQDAIAYAASHDVVVVAAAGNDNIDMEAYPAAFPSVIAVGSTDKNDQQSEFSNYGATWVDVAAPGSAILSTVPGNKYEVFDGTSMASPVVAGLAGLLRTYSPTADALQVREAIETTTVDVGDWIRTGRVDAAAALGSIRPAVNVEGGATSASVYAEGAIAQGRNWSGGVADLEEASDNRAVSLDTIYVPGNGSMASAQISINLPGATSENFLDGTLTVRHTSRREATNSIFLYNFRTNRYDMIKSTPGQATPVDTTITLHKRMTDYIAGGEVRMVLRTYISSRASKSTTSFRLSVDYVHATARLRGEQE